MITVEKLNELFYIKDDHLFNKKTRNPRALKNRQAGTLRPDGYIKIQINKVPYMEHHLIWFINKGEFPKNQIDHRNHQRSDNRMRNLREVTHIQNGQNQKLRGTNTSGHNGVTWDKSRKKWKVMIKVNYKQINVGRYSDLDQAIKARQEANEKHNFHANHGKELVWN